MRQPTPSPADGTAVVLGPTGTSSEAIPGTPPRPTPADGNTPPIAVVGDPAGATSVVRSLAAAGLHAGVFVRATPGTLGPVSVPTVLYRPAAGAAASAVAAVVATRLPETTMLPMPHATDAAAAVVVLLPATPAR